MQVLYPIPVDADSGVSIVFREIGKRSRHEIHGFTRPGFDGDIENITLHKLPEKTHQKAREYATEQMHGYDVIQTCGYPQTLVSIPAKLIRSTSIVHTTHMGSEFLSQKVGKLRLRAHRRLMLSIADEVITVSPFVNNHIESHYGRKGRVIPNGVNQSVFSPSVAETDPDSYLYVGRQQNLKNPEFIFDIAEASPEHSFRVRLNPNRDLRDRADGLANVTLIENRMTHEEMAMEFARANALLCPFEKEGFGLVVLEAFACGTAVIGLNSGNLPNLIEDGKTGLIIDELDVDKWIEALDNCDHRLGDRGPAVAEEYQWDKIAAQYDLVYDEMC